MKRAIERRLSLFSQEHMMEDVKQFDICQMEDCFAQLNRWTPDEIEVQKTSWKGRGRNLSFDSFTDPAMGFFQGGEIRKCAALLLAGGQGSRLGFEGPKGCYPILGKTLFEWHCAKVVADAPVAILTSLLNHKQTVSYFQQRQFFGLQKLSFFPQKTLPLLDEEGKWFWAAPGQIAEGPDGNGSVFAELGKAGILERYEKEGIKTLHVLPVDNPLGDLFDPELNAFHEASGADLSFKCIQIDDPSESMGRLVRVQGRLAIAEYAELNEEQRRENLYANTGLFAIDLALVRLLAKQNFPLHWAWKSVPDWKLGKRFAWKAERFIVDALDFAQNARALCCKRGSCYAPLKEIKSIEAIEKLLML